MSRLKERVDLSLRWVSVISLIGLVSGSLSAFFLVSLSVVTDLRVANSWLIALLPLSGCLFAWLYQKYGGNSNRGNNLIIDQANGGQEKVPWQMIPLTLFGTLTTHLFGGSVGREGTAVQMGGAVASYVSRLCGIQQEHRQLVMMCGISGGFSSVFGTPFAGAFFAIEVLKNGKLSWKGLIPSLGTGLVANQVTKLWQVSHSHYQIGSIPKTSVRLIGWLFLFGILFGLVARLFSFSIVKIKSLYAELFPNQILRNGFGGLVVLLLVFLFQTRRYLGLSLPLLTEAFNGQGLKFDFINKLIFTVFSLGAGFQGGEVTPLFEIGATFGSLLGKIADLPVGFVAALGFVAVFSGATKTPLASVIMGIELFGASTSSWLLLVCFTSYFFSGPTSIYSAQVKKQKVTTLSYIKGILRTLFGR